MGGELPERAAGAAGPRFAVAAMKDAGVPNTPGTDLQRIQVIKGWLDASGAPQERVFEVAGSSDNGAGVNLDTCETTGQGAQNLCTVWQDPTYEKTQSAWYYARVLENPTCRWSQRMCNARQVRCDAPEGPPKGFEGCCAASHRPVIQERAWSSPIWVSAQP